jgi:hypothetical protein
MNSLKKLRKARNRLKKHLEKEPTYHVTFRLNNTPKKTNRFVDFGESHGEAANFVRLLQEGTEERLLWVALWEDNHHGEEGLEIIEQWPDNILKPRKGKRHGKAKKRKAA